MKLSRKLGAAAGALGVGLLAMAGPASAMDCFVVNRSTQGAVGASNSSQWALIDVNQALSQCVTTQQLQEIDTALENAGLPLVFDTRTDKILPSNGHGIMHIDDTYVPIILGVTTDAAPCLGGP
jgi:hypothetical protein